MKEASSDPVLSIREMVWRSFWKSLSLKSSGSRSTTELVVSSACTGWLVGDSKAAAMQSEKQLRTMEWLRFVTLPRSDRSVPFPISLTTPTYGPSRAYLRESRLYQPPTEGFAVKKTIVRPSTLRKQRGLSCLPHFISPVIHPRCRPKARRTGGRAYVLTELVLVRKNSKSPRISLDF